PNTGATNTTGFTALPGGRRNYGGDFGDGSPHWVGYWWSSSLSASYSASFWVLSHNSNNFAHNIYYRQYGYSVRCLKD
ncbi:MAG: FISUMP domain-containing protein, partial [Bacteroidota bacterium]